VCTLFRVLHLQCRMLYICTYIMICMCVPTLGCYIFVEAVKYMYNEQLLGRMFVHVLIQFGNSH
jgi:hypothetical protein